MLICCSTLGSSVPALSVALSAVSTAHVLLHTGRAAELRTLTGRQHNELSAPPRRTPPSSEPFVQIQTASGGSCLDTGQTCFRRNPVNPVRGAPLDVPPSPWLVRNRLPSVAMHGDSVTRTRSSTDTSPISAMASASMEARRTAHYPTTLTSRAGARVWQAFRWWSPEGEGRRGQRGDQSEHLCREDARRQYTGLPLWRRPHPFITRATSP